jgi:hypothetical protein
MANNLTAFQTEMFNFLNNTTNLDQNSKTGLADRFVSKYAEQWVTWRTENSAADNPANRGRLLVHMTVENWKLIWRNQSPKFDQLQ